MTEHDFLGERKAALIREIAEIDRRLIQLGKPCLAPPPTAPYHSPRDYRATGSAYEPAKTRYAPWRNR